jgi:hypothetical protein
MFVTSVDNGWMINNKVERLADFRAMTEGI